MKIELWAYYIGVFDWIYFRLFIEIENAKKVYIFCPYFLIDNSILFINGLFSKTILPHRKSYKVSLVNDPD